MRKDTLIVSTNHDDPRQFMRWVIMLSIIFLLIIVTFYGVATGSVSIGLNKVWDALTQNTETLERQIVWDLRIPRVITGFLVGMSLATSGALLQGVMKNPLADPGIIGVSAGAGLFAVIIMIVTPEYIAFLPLASFLGALFAAGIIYLLAWNQGISPLRIILAGVATNSLLGAFMSAVMIIYSDRVQSVLPWLVGGLSRRSWPHVYMILPYTSVGMILAIFAIKPANALLLGDNVAKLLGHQIEKNRFFLILLNTFLAGIAVSVAGLIGFVGLVVPHIIRLLVGNDYKYLLPLSALGGGVLVIFADTAARSWFDPIELPVGILLAALGAPFFLYLLRRGGISK